MAVVAFLEAARQEVHDRILRDISDRTHEQFLWRPNREISNIAYLLWHLVRIEDLTIQTQFRKAPRTASAVRQSARRLWGMGVLARRFRNRDARGVCRICL